MRIKKRKLIMLRRNFLTTTLASISSLLWFNSDSDANEPIKKSGILLKRKPVKNMQAARTLTAIKIKIGRGLVTIDGKERFQAIYPDFNSLSPTVRQNLDWSYYFDIHGIGWHYDKTDKLGEGADPNVQFGVTAVPNNFAVAAAAAFPNEVTIIGETEFQDFYDNKAHAHELELHHDETILAAIQNKKGLGRPPNDPDDDDALDPDNPKPGLRTNHNKFWALKKVKVNVVIT